MKLNSKKKGNKGENAFSAWLRSHGINAFRDSASGGGSTTKSDIHNSINAHIEVKTTKKINLLKIWKKAINDAGLHNTAYLAVHFDSRPANEWLMVMDNHDWLELIKKSQEPKTTQTENRELQWAIQNSIKSLKLLLNKLE